MIQSEDNTLKPHTPPLRLNANTQRKPLPCKIVTVLLGATVAFHVLMFVKLWSVPSQGHSDFVAFYSAGQILRRGLGAELYNQQTLVRLQRSLAPALVRHLNGPLPYTHPPFEAAIFAPFAGLSYLPAYITWDIVSAVALVISVLLLRPYLPGLRRCSGALPFLCAFAFFPVLWCLIQGQDSTFLLLCFVGIFVAMTHRRDFAAGVCCGLALIKFQYVAPIAAIFLLRRKWKILFGLCSTTMLLATTSVAVVGWSETVQYVPTLAHLSTTNSVMNAQYMANLRGAIERLLGSDSPITIPLVVLVSIVLIVFAARLCRLEPRQPTFALEFSLSVTVCTLVGYHVQPQDLTLLLLPLLLISDALSERSIPLTASSLLLPAVLALFFGLLYVLLLYFSGSIEAMFWIIVLLAVGITIAIGTNQPVTRQQWAASP